MNHPSNHHTGAPPDPTGTDGRTGVLASMCLALVLVVASVSSVNLALTEISLDLGTSSSQLTWIADAYTVALAALVLPFGALGDKLGRRTLLLAGTVVFGIAALLAGMAGTAGELIACRAGMGVGAAMIMPGTLSTITAVFSADRRPRAVSVWAGFASSGAILGLLTCGLVLEWFSWRASFVATAMLAVASFVGSWMLAPNTSDPDEVTIDLPGSVLSAVGVGALVFGIIDGAEAGWTAGSTLAALTIAATSITGFVWWELRTREPMLDVRLFRLRGFATGSLALTVQFFCLFGFFLVGLQFLQLMLDLSPLVSAVSLLPLGMTVMPLSRRAPHVVDQVGARRVMTAGLAFLAGGLAIMSTLDAGSSYWPFLGGLVVFGIGMAFTSTPSTTAIVTSLPRAKQGVASAMNDVSREVGSAIGIAVLGSLFSSGYRDAVAPATAPLPDEAAHAADESAGAGLAIAERLGEPGAALDTAVRNAFATGLADAMRAGTLIAILAAAFVAWRAPRRTDRPDPVSLEPAAQPILTTAERTR
jgi:EmrB/QacA subfamily drug resistance transporter